MTFSSKLSQTIYVTVGGGGGEDQQTLKVKFMNRNTASYNKMNDVLKPYLKNI